MTVPVSPLHDYAKSKAVLIGTWDYRYLTSVAAVQNSMTRMASLLSGSLCGWPADRITALPNHQTILDDRRLGPIPDLLITEFEDIADIALFYFVGHGLLDLDGDLCLCLGETRIELNRRASTSLAYHSVRRAMLDSPARIKIVILDCCYAGQASLPTYTLGDPAYNLLDMTVGTGAYVMTATKGPAVAWYEADTESDWPQTYFTKYLADLIESGIPSMPSRLRLSEIFGNLQDKLLKDRRPKPDHRSVENARDFPFAYNAAWTDGETPAETEREQFTDLLSVAASSPDLTIQTDYDKQWQRGTSSDQLADKTLIDSVQLLEVAPDRLAARFESFIIRELRSASRRRVLEYELIRAAARECRVEPSAADEMLSRLVSNRILIRNPPYISLPLDAR